MSFAPVKGCNNMYSVEMIRIVLQQTLEKSISYSIMIGKLENRLVDIASNLQQLQQKGNMAFAW